MDLNEAKDYGVMGWQWHQLDHMQTICTSLQIDNHTSQAGCSSRWPTNSIRALKGEGI